MRLRKRGFVLFGTTMAVGALLGACTPQPPQTGPTTTPAVTPTPAATTPSETTVEREQRLDFEAAETAYRANIAEQDRLYGKGGVQEATTALRATASGPYLAFTLDGLRGLKKKHLKAVGGVSIVGIDHTAWKEKSVILTSCEDGSKVRLINGAGRDVTPKGPSIGVQELTVSRESGRWKVTDVSTKVVKSLKGQVCGTA